jgi:hypothetical protein
MQPPSISDFGIRISEFQFRNRQSAFRNQDILNTSSKKNHPVNFFLSTINGGRNGARSHGAIDENLLL